MSYFSALLGRRVALVIQAACRIAIVFLVALIVAVVAAFVVAALFVGAIRTEAIRGGSKWRGRCRGAHGGSLSLEHGMVLRELGGRQRRGLASIIKTDDVFPFVVLFGRKCSGVHLQGAAQLVHQRRKVLGFKMLGRGSFGSPLLVGPQGETHEFARDVGGLVLAAEAKVFDLSLVRLAQLVDLFTGYGVCSAHRIGDGLQAVQLDEVLIWVRPRDRVSYPADFVLTKQSTFRQKNNKGQALRD